MKYILSFTLLLSFSVFPQTKYLIYFKDKGVEENVNLQKNNPIFLSALSLLSEKVSSEELKLSAKMISSLTKTFQSILIMFLSLSSLESRSKINSDGSMRSVHI